MIARQFAEQGDADEARRVRDENARLCRSLARSRPDDPTFGLLAALAERERSPGRSVLAIAAEALDRFPEGAPLSLPLASLLGSEIGLELCEAHLTGPALEADPEAIAAAILGELDDRLAGRRIDPAFDHCIVRQLAERPTSMATAARHAGRSDEARRIVDAMFALAGALERRRPGAAANLWMLSKAHEQESKFGWATDDREAIERSLRAALVLATRALSLEPRDELLRRHVAGTREKYVRLVADEPEP